MNVAFLALALVSGTTDSQPLVLVVKDLQLDTTPAFQWRLFKGMQATGLEPWGVKVGFNGFYTSEAALDNGTCNYYPAGFSSSHTWYKLTANRFLQQ